MQVTIKSTRMDRGARAAAQRVRYLAYLDEGCIAPNADGRYADEWDGRPNEETLVAYVLGNPVGTLRMLARQATDPVHVLPAGTAFPVLGGVLGDAAAVEFSRFVVLPSLGPAARTRVQFALLKGAVAINIGLQPEYLVAATRDSQLGLYTDVMGLQRAGGGNGQKTLLVGQPGAIARLLSADEMGDWLRDGELTV